MLFHFNFQFRTITFKVQLNYKEPNLFIGVTKPCPSRIRHFGKQITEISSKISPLGG